MRVYEYKTITFETGQSISTFSFSMEDEFNFLGKDGWELVSLISNPHLGSTKYALVDISINILSVLKRKKCERENK